MKDDAEARAERALRNVNESIKQAALAFEESATALRCFGEMLQNWPQRDE